MIASPVWLWLSAAIIIPVAIHLWNRRTGKPILLGTYRFLPAKTFNAPHHFQLHEIPLLLLRILMIALISLLLADIIWQTNAEPVKKISIKETSARSSLFKENNENQYLIEIPSKTVQEKKWWNILAQILHDQYPDSISITGTFSVHDFGLQRLATAAEVEWVFSDSLLHDDKVHVIWNSKNSPYHELIQKRSTAGISLEIEKHQQATDSRETDILVLDSLLLLINAQNSEEIKNGLKYAAHIWQIETEEREMAEMANLLSSTKSWPLLQLSSENGVNEMVPPNPILGIQMEVEGLDTTYQSHNSANYFIRSHSNYPVLFGGADTLFINGRFQPEFEGWAYASIGSALIWKAFNINNEIYPLLAEKQRIANHSSEAIESPVKKRSARFWMFSILMLCWLTERSVAAKRGM